MDRARILHVGGRLAALGLLAGLGACSLSERAETLFLRQNRAANALAELIFATEVDRPALADALYVTESEFDDACAPLRRAGYLHLQAENVDSGLEWAIVNTMDACTAKTGAVEHLVWQINPHIATFFLLPLPPIAPSEPVPGFQSGGLPDLGLTPQ